jgi:hypothetical protein
MTFTDYMGYRMQESLISFLLWVALFGAIGVWALARFLIRARKDHKNFKRMVEELNSKEKSDL